VARVFLSQSCSLENGKPVIFDTQAKTALEKHYLSNSYF